MANSHFDDDFMRFLNQTAEYFEFDEIDHIFNSQTAANDDMHENIYHTYNYIKQLNTLADNIEITNT
jgi:hypothetical protein